jgi:hypothetical protein
MTQRESPDLLQSLGRDLLLQAAPGTSWMAFRRPDGSARRSRAGAETPRRPAREITWEISGASEWPGWEVRAVEAAVVRATQDRGVAEKEIEVEVEDPLHRGPLYVACSGPAGGRPLSLKRHRGLPCAGQPRASDSSRLTRAAGMPSARPAAASWRPAKASSPRLSTNAITGVMCTPFCSGGDASRHD